MRMRNHKKALVLFAVLALVICMAQTAVFAQNTVNISNGAYENGSITVTGSISANGAYMNILAIKTNDPNVELSSYATNEDLAAAIVYMDQVTATSDNYSKTWTFPINSNVTESYIVVFLSGTDATATRQAISLTTVGPTYENGTFALVPYTGGRTYYLGGTQNPAFTLTGDDAWKEQLEIKVYWQTIEENATIDKAAGTITMAVPQTVTTYTVKANNTSANYPAFSQEATFKYVSAAGEEFAALPANLGVTVDKDDDSKYSFVVPEDTENVTFTATIDGVAADAKSFDVEKGAEAKTVVITATAPQTLSKSYTVTVPAAETVVPVISADDIEIIDADGNPVYEDFLTGDNVIVTIAAGDIDPDTQKITVAGAEFYYVASRDYFVGIVSRADKDAIIADVEIADGESDRIVYGKDPINGDLDEPIDTMDYIAVKKITLNKGKAPTAKQLLAADVGNGEMDGAIDTADFAAIKKVALGKVDDLAINEG